MKRELFDELVIDVEDEEPYRMKLTYYLLTENVREEYCDLKVYGAEIDKEKIYAGGMCENECKIVKNLFFRHREAERFLKKLVIGRVTPMGLKDAAREHIGEQIRLLTYEG